MQLRTRFGKAACLLLLTLAFNQAGCVHLHEHRVRNPYPQLSKIAVAPFFNLSTEPSVDGREFAVQYYNELQQVPGYEVIPVGVVEQAAASYGLSLQNPEEARELAQILDVDAIAIGAVTDFTPYYPPRCAMMVEWYAANPYYHPIPPGYGLPFDTPQQEQIPSRLMYEAEFAQAQAQLKPLSPPYQKSDVRPPLLPPSPAAPGDTTPPEGQLLAHQEIVQQEIFAESTSEFIVGSGDLTGTVSHPAALLHGGKRVFSPSPHHSAAGPLLPSGKPVMRHVATYNGDDAEFTCALKGYRELRDDDRFGGWQAYLRRTDDFIGFCCRKHVFEMLSARGGADQSTVVWQWPKLR